MRPADPDDIDARFEALVAQFGEDEIRSMVTAAERDPLTRRARRRRLPAVLVAIAAAVLVVGLVVTVRPDALERLGVGGTAPGDDDRFVTGAVVARPGPVLTPIPDGEEGLADLDPAPAGPFTGTPAAGFADGEEGLVMPPARKLGGLTEDEVGRALLRVRGLLSAAHLDPATVRGGRPDRFAGLLHPRQRKTFLSGLDESGPSGTRSWVFSLAPGAADPAGDVVKVSGAMTVGARTGGGVRIEADYLFVHPVTRPGDSLTVTRVVEHHRSEFAAYREGGRLVVWLDGDRSALFGASCDTGDGFVHPYFPGDPREARPSGEPVNPYDRASAVSRRPACPAAYAT
ncbi:hypothetical protein [Microbispora sp. NBC_01389]|uniref:hypothetical protein n=1 Tax=Microbispora sp. NBC_01389 TaxID=2903584 RepID=UPI0032461373